MSQCRKCKRGPFIHSVAKYQKIEGGTVGSMKIISKTSLIVMKKILSGSLVCFPGSGRWFFGRGSELLKSLVVVFFIRVRTDIRSLRF